MKKENDLPNSFKRFTFHPDSFLVFSIVFFTLMLTAVSGIHPAGAQEFRQPDCTSLEQWSAESNPKETFSIAPEIELPGLLKDERTLPLFDRTAEQRGAEQFTAVRGWLFNCRAVASKRKDQDASKNLYAAMKTLTRASNPNDATAVWPILMSWITTGSARSTSLSITRAC